MALWMRIRYSEWYWQWSTQTVWTLNITCDYVSLRRHQDVLINNAHKMTLAFLKPFLISLVHFASCILIVNFKAILARKEMMHSWAKPTSTVELKRMWPLKILRSDCILTLHNSFVLLFKYVHSIVKEARNQSQIFNRKSISRNTTHRRSYHLQAMLTGVKRRKDTEPSRLIPLKQGFLTFFLQFPSF